MGAYATFLFHGELTAFLPPERRGGTFARDCARAATIKHAVESLGVPHTEVGRVTVNGHPATLSRTVRDGEVIEVFPHQTAEIFPDAPPRFIADAHLGGLAPLLRMLGVDTLFENTWDDREMVELAHRERRIVLTRDRELLKRRDVLRGSFVRAIKPQAQLGEVVTRYADLSANARDALAFGLDCDRYVEESNTVSPVVQLFIDHLRAVAKTMFAPPSPG